jgi:hypothetical protein
MTCSSDRRTSPHGRPQKRQPELVGSTCRAVEVNDAADVLDVTPSIMIKSIDGLSIGFPAVAAVLQPAHTDWNNRRWYPSAIVTFRAHSGHIPGTSRRDLPRTVENRSDLNRRSEHMYGAFAVVSKTRTQDPAYRPTRDLLTSAVTSRLGP